MKLKNFFLKNKFYRFIFFGSYLNLFGYLTYLFFSTFLEIKPTTALLFTHSILIVKTYVIHSLLVFENNFSKKKVGFFFLNYLFILTLNYFLLNYFAVIKSYDHKIVQIIILIFLAGLSFLISRNIIFKK